MLRLRVGLIGLLFFLALPSFLILPSDVWAHKLDVMTGGYSLSAATSEGDGSKSGPGLYRVNYLMPVLDNLEVGLGYTIISSQVVGGDLAFGFDLNGYYFPITRLGGNRISSEYSTLTTEEVWRPFVGFGFHQRQFQSVSTNFAGFSLGLGAERAFQQNLSFKGELRYITFNGPSGSTATEMGLSLGMSLSF